MLSVEKSQEKNYINKNKFADFIAANWRGLLSRLPLIALGLAASYGVYAFARHYVPEFFAVCTAVAFEAVYIGLAIATSLTEEERKRARYISMGAVAVSIMFNWTSGVIDSMPNPDEWFSKIAFEIKIILAFLHGAPLSLLGFFVADLVLHSNASEIITKAAQTIIDNLQKELEQIKLALSSVEKENAELHSRLTLVESEQVVLRSESESLRTHSADVETKLSALESIVQWLQSLSTPVRWDSVDAEFKVVEIVQLPTEPKELPKPFALDVPAIALKIGMLGAGLQRRQVTVQLAELTGREAGQPFGKADFDSEVSRILEAVKVSVSND